MVEAARERVDTEAGRWSQSDAVLRILRPGLEQLGFQVERSKKSADKLRRPVLFGAQGRPELAYEIDAFHPQHGILLEVEAGRALNGNAMYRDLVQMSLMADGNAAVLLVPVVYNKQSKDGAYSRPYRTLVSVLEAIYASGRLQLPFETVVAIGY